MRPRAADETDDDAAANDTLVIDTNVFVGAGFHDGSASARILERVERGELRMLWTESTRAETLRILRQIPPLDESGARDLFREQERRPESEDTSAYSFVSGEMDRRFLALAEAAGVPLITSDSDLLDVRDRARVPILTPGELER